MKRTTLVVLISIVLTNFALVNANAGSMCNNGTMSSNSGRGTCSYNGGVNKNFPSYSDPGSSSYNRNNGYGTQKSRRWQKSLSKTKHIDEQYSTHETIGCNTHFIFFSFTSELGITSSCH